MASAPRRPATRWRIILAALLIAVVGGGCLFRFGRALWHPLLAMARGGTSVDRRLDEIRARHPDLAGLRAERVAIACFKRERRVDVAIDGRWWRSFPMTATSGVLGPKTREGDLQVPEGIYAIDAVNPDSLYHLSLRVSYPNAEDRARGTLLGVTDLGGDIYIHGGSASVGCIALGDDAIEQVFYVAHLVEPRSIAVIIAPADLRRDRARLPDQPDLYAGIRAALDAMPPAP